MALTVRPIRVAIVAASLALTTAVATAAFAQAAETEDPRAVAHDGNASTCEGAGLAGELVDDGDLTYTDGKINVDQSITITGVADGLTVTGIVVKGGNAYNVYEPGERGLSADVPWKNLIAPTNDGGQQPALSHWFVCAEGDTEPSEPPTSSEPPPSEPSEPPPSEPTEPPSSEPSEPPSSEPTEPSSSEPTEPSTTEPSDTPPSSVEPDEDDLALTGFGAGWLIPIGALLLIGGGSALWLARNRRQV